MNLNVKFYCKQGNICKRTSYYNTKSAYNGIEQDYSISELKILKTQ